MRINYAWFFIPEKLVFLDFGSGSFIRRLLTLIYLPSLVHPKLRCCVWGMPVSLKKRLWKKTFVPFPLRPSRKAHGRRWLGKDIYFCSLCPWGNLEEFINPSFVVIRRHGGQYRRLFSLIQGRFTCVTLISIYGIYPHQSLVH